MDSKPNAEDVAFIQELTLELQDQYIDNDPAWIQTLQRLADFAFELTNRLSDFGYTPNEHFGDAKKKGV